MVRTQTLCWSLYYKSAIIHVMQRCAYEHATVDQPLV